MPTATCSVSRRDFITSVATAGAGLLALPRGVHAQRNAVASGGKGRIDVHSHIVPPALVRALGAQRLGAVLAGWTPEKNLTDMDGAGVTTAVTSIAPAGNPFSDAAVTPRLTRECNEYAARLASDHPGRFGVFASLPLPNIDQTLAEVAYAFDTLKTDGVAMFTNYGNKWLGDPAFDPVFEELNRRKAVVYTHPATANCCGSLLPDIADSAIEWGTDTTRAIARIVFGGAAARYPNVRLIFSHAGGTMPFLVERFVLMAKSAQFAPRLPQGFLGVAASFFYDTAQTANPAAMSALSRVVPRTQIVFGTDYPFRNAGEHVKGLEECGVFAAPDLEAIGQTNAVALLPRFRP